MADYVTKLQMIELLYRHFYEEAGQLIKYVQELPTANAEPVKYAHWEFVRDIEDSCNVVRRCSECGAQDDQAASLHVPYCWKCGAKMLRNPHSDVIVVHGVRRDDDPVFKNGTVFQFDGEVYKIGYLLGQDSYSQTYGLEKIEV